MDSEFSKRIIDDVRKQGYVWWAKYMELFGVDEPIMECCIFPSDFRRRETIAKACVERGKPAKELGLYEAIPEDLIK